MICFFDPDFPNKWVFLAIFLKKLILDLIELWEYNTNFWNLFMCLNWFGGSSFIKLPA